MNARRLSSVALLCLCSVNANARTPQDLWNESQRVTGAAYAGNPEVRKHPSGAYLFKSRLDLDSDGSVYCKQDATGQAETSLRYADNASVDSNAVPYFVLPGSSAAVFGAAGKGDVGVLLFGEHVVNAVVGDIGPRSKLGEASIQAFRKLGAERVDPTRPHKQYVQCDQLPSDGNEGRFINADMPDAGTVLTVLFPGTASAQPHVDQTALLAWIDSVAAQRWNALLQPTAAVPPAELNAATAPPPAKAEFAVRWFVKPGAPDVQQVLTLFEATGAKADRYKVRYFDPINGTATDKPIIRIRTRVKDSGKDGDSTVMVKIRGEGGFPLDPANARDWHCVLGDGTVNKDEVDISWTTEGQLRAYSRSCTLDDQQQPTLPSMVKATAQPCTIAMARTKANMPGPTLRSVKIEEWTFPDATKVIEVSSGDRLDTADELQWFTETVYQPLLAKGIAPVAEGKTRLAAGCI